MASRSEWLVRAAWLSCEVERGRNYILHGLGYRRKYYSQKGQDRWIVEKVFNGQKGGYFVEIGATDGVTHSNTYILERDYYWTGLLIEANPKYARMLEVNRSSQKMLSCVDGESSEVSFFGFGHMGGIVADDTDYAPRKRSAVTQKYPDRILKLRSRSLAEILNSAKAPTRIQYLSIDVEGAEARILRTFPFDRYIFEALTVERPTSAVHGILSQAGYVLAEVRWRDGFYLNRDVAMRLNIPTRDFDGIPSKSF